MVRTVVVVLLLLLFIPSFSIPSDNITKKQLEDALKRKLPGKEIYVEEFKVKPYWVIRVGNRILLVDPKNRLIFPAAFDFSGRDILKSYKEEIFKDALSKLKLDDFVHYTKSPKGNAPKVLLFTDPKCPFCKRVFYLLRGPAKQGDIDLYIGFIPVHRNRDQIVGILCSKDPGDTYERIVDGLKVGVKPCPEGRRRLDKQINAARSLGFGVTWRGVPSTFVIDKKIHIMGANIKELKRVLGLKKKG